MALAFVQGVSATGASGTSPQAAPAFGSSVAIGDLIVVLAGGDGGVTGAATSVADSLSNTYTRVPSFDFANAGGTLNMDAFYSVATHAGASNVVSLTFNAAAENCVLVVQHFNGFTGTATLDKTAKSSNVSSTTITSGATATLAVATELVVGLGIHASTVSAISLGAGYTNLTEVSIASREAAMESKVVAATTAVTATFSIAAARVNMGGVLTFQDIASTPSASITQVAATVTATGGTQTVATVRNVAISQLAATVTATGGTQTAQSRAAVAQLAATITAAGGTQTVLSVANAAITQVAATVTATGGAQVALAAFQANISQVAATITATGGTQVVASSRKVAIAQLAATVTATGGTQVLASSRFVSLAQLAAIITATGGTQVLAANRLAQISQVAAAILATGGTQSIFLTSVFTYATITLSSGTNSGNDSTGTNIVDVSGSGILDSVNTQINTTNQSGGTKDVTLQTSTNNEILDS